MSGRWLVALALIATACTDMPTGPGGSARLASNVSGLSFGVKEPGAPAVMRTLTIINEGTGTSGPLEVVIEGTGGAVFAIDSAASSCVGRRLAPAASCDVTVAFGGPAAGPQSATVFIDDGEGMDRLGVTLNGILQAILSVFIQGNGHGSVRVEPSGPGCEPVCALTLVSPTVTLTAIPAGDSNFVEWIGAPGCSTNTRCTLALIDINAVTVRFNLR